MRVLARITLRHQYSKTLKITTQHQLITHGLYHYIRHPAYTGSTLLSLGLPLLFNSLLGFFTMLPFLSLILLRIHIEEQMLLQKFGSQYEEYQKTTKRLIPFIY